MAYSVEAFRTGYNALDAFNILYEDMSDLYMGLYAIDVEFIRSVLRPPSLYGTLRKGQWAGPPYKNTTRVAVALQ